jgi:hypothetical protein
MVYSGRQEGQGDRRRPLLDADDHLTLPTLTINFLACQVYTTKSPLSLRPFPKKLSRSSTCWENR